MRPAAPFGSRKLCLVLVLATFAISRCIYYWMGVRFDPENLDFYWQIIDPALLSGDLWRSLFYLRAQLPGFNFYLGSMMHLFPGHLTAAFHATYLLLGLVLGICLFLLLDRLRLSRPVALLITVTCIVSPVTVLYENWLFYEYPLAVLFCVSALFLHRYASSHHRLDGIVFFTSLLLIALLRVIYHFLWFWIIVAVLVYVLPKCRRRTLLCAAAPGAVLSLVYLKSLILFGLFLPGSDVYGAINLAYMTRFTLPQEALASMVAKGAVSPILLHDFEDEELLQAVPLPPKTGIPILDQRLKSNGNINMDSLWMEAVGRQLHKDGLALLRAHPEATLETISGSVGLYFLPADAGFPFVSGPSANRELLSPFLKVFDLVVSGKDPSNDYAFFSYLTIPILLGFGFWRSRRWLKTALPNHARQSTAAQPSGCDVQNENSSTEPRASARGPIGGFGQQTELGFVPRWLRRAVRRPRGNPLDLTIVFAFGNIAYLSAVVVFTVYMDQNRYRFEVFPLFVVLLGALIGFATSRCRALWSARKKSETD
jgi:hypothetical protein